ncbi:hypothetical protein F2P81_006236 [Scophthalmus maximus]|uniref:Uncharacterized protein n=1 Tax=Scophthalmus maximus TaxID=52904 RepID=A0A6A4T7M2_SCOMX|nr:hypothetical protein F2P81_006236 [Scophthalmus maximus]
MKGGGADEARDAPLHLEERPEEKKRHQSRGISAEGHVTPALGYGGGSVSLKTQLCIEATKCFIKCPPIDLARGGTPVSVLCMKKVLTLVLLLEHKNPKELKLVAPPRRSSRVHENNEKKFLTLLLVLIVKPRSSNPPLFVSSESLRHDVPKMCGLEKIKKRSTCIQSHSWKGPSSR